MKQENNLLNLKIYLANKQSDLLKERSKILKKEIDKNLQDQELSFNSGKIQQIRNTIRTIDVMLLGNFKKGEN